MSMRVAAVVILLLLLTPGWPASAWESDDPAYAEVDDPALPSSNSIATLLPSSLEAAPTAAGSVGSTLLYEQNAFVLGDALKNVSGVNVQNGSGVHEFFSIRGFDSSGRGEILTDGVSEPGSAFFSMYNVAGVEVYKGPAGFLFGGGPLAGAVNIVRKQPMPVNFAMVRASTGSFASNDGTLDWNQASRGGDLSFRLNGFWRESDHYRDEKESRHMAVNPSLTWNVGMFSRINVNFEQVDEEYSPDNGIPLVDNLIPDVPRRRSYQSASDFSEQELSRGQIDFESRPSERLTLRNKTYYRGIDRKSEASLITGTTPLPFGNGIRVQRRLAVSDDSQSVIGNRSEALFTLRTGSVEHALLIGLEIVRTTDEFTYDVLPETDLELDTLEELTAALPLARSSSGDLDRIAIAPFVIDQMKLSPRFDLLLGLRYDYIDSDGDVLLLESNDTVQYDRDDGELGPMIGLTFSATADLTFFGSAAQTEQPPSVRLLDEEGSGELASEESRQFELGVKKQFRGGTIRSSFAAYQLERENTAITIADAFLQESGDQRSRGLEIELVAEPTPRLRASFSYAYNDAELTDFAPCLAALFGCNEVDFTGNTPIMAPEHLAHLWATRSFANGWGLGGGVRHIGEQFLSEDNAFELDSATVVDLSVIYEISAWRFRFNAKNLTDEEYETRGASGSASVIPADGVSLYGSAEYRF